MTVKITLRSQLLSASGGVDQVVFADGTVWNRAALLAMATAPTTGNDTFYGRLSGEYAVWRRRR